MNHQYMYLCSTIYIECTMQDARLRKDALCILQFGMLFKRLKVIIWIVLFPPLVSRWIKEAAQTLRKQDPALPENRALNRCEACFNWVWTVKSTQHCLYMDSPGYMKHSYMTRNPCTKHQDKGKKKAVCVLPVQCYTADFWTHFCFNYSLAQRAATLQIRLNYTASNIVSAQPRNSRGKSNKA